MTDLVKQALAGMGALIALYLLVKYGDGFAKVVSSSGTTIVNVDKTLQGR